MAELESEELGVKLTVKDRPTVREQLRYKSMMVSITDPTLLEQLWLAAPQLIEKYECEALPLTANLDEVSDPKLVDIIQWVGLAVNKHYRELEEMPKN